MGQHSRWRYGGGVGVRHYGLTLAGNYSRGAKAIDDANENESQRVEHPQKKNSSPRDFKFRKQGPSRPQASSPRSEDMCSVLAGTEVLVYHPEGLIRYQVKNGNSMLQMSESVELFAYLW